MIYSFLFPTKSNTTKVSLLLLAVRIIFGILLMNRKSPISRISNFWRTRMFDGIYHRIPVSLGNDPDDFHNDSSLLCCSC